MPRSSRSKSHKQSKHSTREYSDFDEDVKMKERNSNNDGKEDGVSVRVSKDSSVSGEKRKLGKDLSGNYANGNVSEEHTTPSKRRKERIHSGSDRWNGDSGEAICEVVDMDNKKLKSKDLLIVVGESKSKSSRRHDVDSASAVVAEKEESKNGSGNRGEKRSEKESGRKEGHQFKENKEPKDKERGSERERKIHDGKRADEVLLKQVEDQPCKRGRGTNEWPIEEELRNIELEKELEKRIRRRDGSSDKDRYQDDVKDSDKRTLSTKSGHTNDIKHKDEKHKDKHREDNERVSKSRDAKYRLESEKDNKHRDDKYREDGNRDNRHKDDKHRDDGDRDGKHRDEKYRNRDNKHRQDDDRDYRRKEDRHREDVDRDHRHKNGWPRDDTDREKRISDSKHRDVHTSSEFETKNSKDDRKTNKRGGSPIYDDRVAKHKDDKDRRRDNDKDESTDYRSHSIKDHHSESEKRPMNYAKVDPISERGRPNSCDDVDITANHGRQRSSPSSKFYPARDHCRVSKQEETKYREDRARHNVNSDFTSAPGQSDDISSRSLEKTTQKDDNYIDGLSVERRMRSDKSPSSTSNEHKHQVKDGKGSHRLAMEAHPDNNISQIDGFSGNYKPPLPFRTGPDSPLGFGSLEDDRGKSNNRYRRLGDPNMGRPQNNWKNIPNWPSPFANGGYLPFPHVPPIFHPVMQQFAPPIFGRPPVNVNHVGMPYHGPDGDRFLGHGPPLWDPNNGRLGDEPHGYGRLDWDHGRTQLNNRMWESNAEFWKQGQDGGVNADMQFTQKNDHLENEIWSGETGWNLENEQRQLDIIIQAETTNDTPEDMKVTEIPHVSEVVKEDDTLISLVYLSKIDISEDLAQPELYDQCTSMVGLDEAVVTDEFDCKILFLEEGIEAGISNGASLFVDVDDSVFKKAMSLYTKQKVEVVATIQEGAIGSGDDEKPVKEAVSGPVLEVNNEKDEASSHKLDRNPVNELQKSVCEPISTSGKVDNPVVKHEEESCAPSVKDNKELFDKASGGSLLVLRDVMSVNLSRIHHGSH